jgi:hypothetical protein
VRVEDRVEDRLPSTRPGGRDDGVAERFEQWLAARPAGAPPYFAFLLLDAPHQSYWFPADCARFQPCVDEVAYTSIDAEAGPELRRRSSIATRTPCTTPTRPPGACSTPCAPTAGPRTRWWS